MIFQTLHSFHPYLCTSSDTDQRSGTSGSRRSVANSSSEQRSQDKRREEVLKMAELFEERSSVGCYFTFGTETVNTEQLADDWTGTVIVTVNYI